MSLDEQKIALDFVDYLEKEKFIFVKDNGYWKDKIYYLIKYKNEGICFILIKDPHPPTTAPTIPSRIVIKNPPPSLPGMIHFARIPAISPKIIHDRMPIVSSLICFALAG